MVVPAQGAVVVLQFDKVHPLAAEDDEIDLVPLALTVPELEVRPGTEGRLVRQEVLDEVQPLRLVRELCGCHLHPPFARHHPVVPPPRRLRLRRLRLGRDGADSPTSSSMAIWGDSSGQVCASDEVSLIQLSLLGPTNSRRGTL